MLENQKPDRAALDAASDDELAVLAKDSVDAEALLLTRYLKIIRYHANRYASSDADAEDMVQEGLIVLLHAISEYREERQVKFSTFAQTCIINKLKSLARRQKNSASPVADISQVMEEQSVLTDAETPESIFLEKENFAHCRMQVMALLSRREWEILQCIMMGDSYLQTAQKLHISEKSVDNAMQRVRRKMRSVESKEYFL